MTKFHLVDQFANSLMRSYLLFTCSCLVLLSHITVAQRHPIVNLQIENASYKTILDSIADQTNYAFSYSSSSLDLETEISIRIEDLELNKALDQLFEFQSIDYSIKNNKVILRPGNIRQAVKGTVLDNESRQPVVGANVVLKAKTLQGTITDANGHFIIPDVPLGRQNFIVSNIGYESRTLANILVGAGKEINLQVMMVEKLQSMQEVVITSTNKKLNTPLNDMATVSARSFSMEETKRFAASIGDPGRLVLSYPGVTTTDDSGNEIVVRGNSPKGLLWRVEGVEIPSPNHFSSEGGSGGGLSMFSTQMMARSDFFTGAFPAQYGNALSGVFDINLRKGNADRNEFTLQAGFLGLDVSAEGPLSKKSKSSFLFNYRYSTLAILSSLGVVITDENEENVFQDLSFKIHLPNKKWGDISIYGIGGLSEFSERFANEIAVENYNLGMIGISHIKPIDKSSFISSRLSITGTRTYDKQTINGIFQDTSTNTTRPVRDVDVTDISKQYYRAQSFYNKRISSKTNFETGLILSFIKYNYESFSDNEFVPDSSLLRRFDPYLENEGTTYQQAYFSANHRFSSQWSTVFGAHISYFKLSEELIVEPRLGLTFSPDPKNQIALGFGLHSRQEPLEFYFATDEEDRSYQPNLDLKVIRASHYVLSYLHRFSTNLTFQAELYYQHLFNVPINVTPGTFPVSALSYDSGLDPDSVIQILNEGTGRNFGIDLVLNKQFGNHYYFAVNGSLYRSKYTGYDGEEHNTKYDGVYNFSFSGGKEFVLNAKKMLGLNFRWLHNGNRRFTPWEITENESPSVFRYRIDFDREEINTHSYRDFIRLDLQFYYRTNKPKLTTEWRIDVQNVFNRNNIWSNWYNPATGETGFNYMLKRIPVLSYRIEF